MKPARLARLSPFTPASLAGLALAAPAALVAQTWVANPTSNIFNDAANWNSGVIPLGNTAVATFGVSSNTGINVTTRVTTGTLHFTSEATAPYFFTFNNTGSNSTHFLRTGGIVNDSAWAPTLIFQGALFNLSAGATLDDANVIFNGGSFTFNGLGGTSTIQMNGGTLAHARSEIPADGQNARLILNGGILGSANTTDTVAMNFGSIEGNGTIGLNFTSTLTVGQNNRDATFSGSIIESDGSPLTPAITKVGTGVWSLVGASNTSDATISILGGAIATDADSRLGLGSGLTLDGGAIRYASAFTNLRTLVLGPGGGAIDTQALDVTHSTGIGGSGGLTKLGSGSLTLSTANTYAGGTTHSVGTLVVGHDSALGTGALRLAGGALAANGTRTLANAVTLSAATTIKGSSAITFHGGWTLAGTHALTVSNSATTRIAGSIGETGGPRVFLKYGAGTLELTGANTYTGGTLLAEGVTRINNSTGSAFGTGAVTLGAGATLTGAGSFSGAFQNNGTYAPGNSPTLATLSSFSQGDTGVLEMELAGLSRGAGYDALDIAGSFSPDGTLRVLLMDGFSPSAGDIFDLFDFNPTSISGTFATLDLPTLQMGLSWDDSELYTTGVLTVQGAPIPEPAAAAVLAGFGVLSLAVSRRRRAAF